MPRAVATVVARDVCVLFADMSVLDHISVTVGPSDRIGVVAPNGTGKSTLLRVLAGLHVPDTGSVERMPRDATVGYLAQEPERSTVESVAEQLARRTGVAAASRALEAATETMAAGETGAVDEYGVLLEQWLALGGDDFEARVGETLSDLGLDGPIANTPTSSLSGGQAARVGLSAILLARFDVLLLDEPTNDLDGDGLDRLEHYVLSRSGGLVVVSHDREFLHRTVTSVFELDEFTRTGTLFEGGWDAYLDARATAQRHAREAFDVYDSKRSDLLERAQRQREWAAQGAKRAKAKPKDGDKFIRAHNKAQTEKLASKAAASARALERLEVIEQPREPWELRFSIAAAPRAGAVVARLESAVFGRGDFTMGPVDLEVGWAERVAIVGPNGAGKTTLLAALLGELPLRSGRQWLGPSVVVGRVDQARRQFASDQRLMDSFAAASGMGRQDVRTLLAKFGLGATDVVRSAGTLSPGERTRAELALLMARGVNCLVLDEPTNHLDLPAIEQLEMALESYDATLLLVTHDRRFRDAVRIDREIDVRGVK